MVSNTTMQWFTGQMIHLRSSHSRRKWAMFQSLCAPILTSILFREPELSTYFSQTSTVPELTWKWGCSLWKSCLLAHVYDAWCWPWSNFLPLIPCYCGLYLINSASISDFFTGWWITPHALVKLWFSCLNFWVLAWFILTVLRYLHWRSLPL